MPVNLEDPASPVTYRASGAEPHPGLDAPLPPQVVPRRVTVKGSVTVATVVPFAGASGVPPSLLAYLSDQLNREIERGDSFPMDQPISLADFGPYWFGNFGAVMLLGHVEGAGGVDDGRDWAKECLGTFYVKPNYPGRSSHVCTGAFIVTDRSLDRDVRKQMGQAYLEWAPMLGYTYSVFNLVYETNVASCRIWDELGFQQIGRIPGAGKLRSHPVGLVDAIIYGRNLGATSTDGDDSTGDDRYGKIRTYLIHSKHLPGADQLEKERLLTAAKNYKLSADGRLLFRDGKEIVSDPQKQYETARAAHEAGHLGINRTTASLAKRYRWSRMRDTAQHVIRDCSRCGRKSKTAEAGADATTTQGSPGGIQTAVPAAGQESTLSRPGHDTEYDVGSRGHHQPDAGPSRQSPPFRMSLQQTAGSQQSVAPTTPPPQVSSHTAAQPQAGSMSHRVSQHPFDPSDPFVDIYGGVESDGVPVDPCFMEGLQYHVPSYQAPDGQDIPAALPRHTPHPDQQPQPQEQQEPHPHPHGACHGEHFTSTHSEPYFDYQALLDSEHLYEELLLSDQLTPQAHAYGTSSPTLARRRPAHISPAFSAQVPPGSLPQSPLDYSLGSQLPYGQPLYSPADHRFPAQSPSGSMQRSLLGSQAPQGQPQYSPVDHGFLAQGYGSLQQPPLGSQDSHSQGLPPPGLSQQSPLGSRVPQGLPLYSPDDHGFPTQASPGPLPQSPLHAQPPQDQPLYSPVDSGFPAQTSLGSLQQSPLGHQPPQGQTHYSPADHGSHAQVPQGSAHHLSPGSGTPSRLPQGSSHPNTRTPGPPLLGGSMRGDEVYYLQQEVTTSQKRRAAAARIRSLRRIGRPRRSVDPWAHERRTQAARQQPIPGALPQPPIAVGQVMADTAASIPLDSGGEVGPSADPGTGTAPIGLGLTVATPTAATTTNPAMLTATIMNVSPAAPIPDAPRPPARHDDQASDERTTPRAKER